MKGWYGNRQKHALASKGVRSKGSLSTMEREDRAFWLDKEMGLLKSNPESINWEEVDEIYDSMGIGKKPKEYNEYDSRTLIKIWNVHYKMFNNISSWGGDATDHLNEMNEIQRELAKKGYEPSGEFSQEGNMKFIAKGYINKNGHHIMTFDELRPDIKEIVWSRTTQQQRDEEEFDEDGIMVY